MTKGVKIILSRRCAICREASREGIKGNETINLPIASSMIDLCSLYFLFFDPTPDFQRGPPRRIFKKKLRPFLLKISTNNPKSLFAQQTIITK